MKFFMSNLFVGLARPSLCLVHFSAAFAALSLNAPRSAQEPLTCLGLP